MDTNQENKNTTPEKMEIEISRYKTLIEALDDPKRVVRLIILLSAVAIILAFGILGIIYGIKRFYPYKSINSNDYGATFIKDEDNEIIYWLFNTADLWANSGIEVKEGDVISVRTSGAFHPSIHHLVQDADSNIKLRDPWVLSGGKGRLEFGQLYKQEAARDKFRIAPYAPFSAILMQVIPNDIANMDRGWIKKPSNAPYVDGCPDSVCSQDLRKDTVLKKQKKDKFISPDIYVIGQGKESIRIRKNGMLHFAVNDVPLTLSNILRMEQSEEDVKFDTVRGIWYFIPKNPSDTLIKSLGNKIDYSKWFVVDTSRKAKVGEIISTEFWNKDYLRQIGIMVDSLKPWPDSLKKQKQILLNLPKAYEADSTITYLKYLKDNLNWIDTIWPPRENEYYKDRKFVDAWFVDNVGSFMIVIERKTDK